MVGEQRHGDRDGGPGRPLEGAGGGEGQPGGNRPTPRREHQREKQQSGQRQVHAADAERKSHGRRGDERADRVATRRAAGDRRGTAGRAPDRTPGRPQTAEERHRTPEPGITQQPGQGATLAQHRARYPEHGHARQVRGDLAHRARVGQVRRGLVQGQQPGALDHADLALCRAGQHQKYEGHDHGTADGRPDRDGATARARRHRGDRRAEVAQAGAHAPHTVRLGCRDERKHSGPRSCHEPAATPQFPVVRTKLSPMNQHSSIASGASGQVMTARSRPEGRVFPTIARPLARVVESAPTGLLSREFDGDLVGRRMVDLATRDPAAAACADRAVFLVGGRVVGQPDPASPDPSRRGGTRPEGLIGLGDGRDN